MDKTKAKNKRRQRRRFHTRKKIRGTADHPRLTVQRSLKHISCQIVDDQTGATLVSASTNQRDLRESIQYGGNRDAASAVGKAIAEKAIAVGIKNVKFDRGHCKYHGRVAALADAAREAGLSL